MKCSTIPALGITVTLALAAACVGPDVEVEHDQASIDPLERPSEEPLLRALFGSFGEVDIADTFDPVQRFYFDRLWGTLSQSTLSFPDWQARPLTAPREQYLRRLVAGYVALHPMGDLERDLAQRQQTEIIAGSKLGCIAMAFQQYQPDAAPREFARRLSGFVRQTRDHLGASFDDMFTLYILSDDPTRGFFRYDSIYGWGEESRKVYLYQGEWTVGVSRNLADDVFGRKATPSVELNNLVAAELAKPIPWEQLAMGESDSFVQYWMRDWVAKQIYTHPVITAFIPVIGQVVALDNRLLDIMEGPSFANAPEERLWQIALFMGEYALAVVDFYGATAAARSGATFTVQIARSTRERLARLVRAAKSPGHAGLTPKAFLRWERRVLGEGVHDAEEFAATFQTPPPPPPGIPVKPMPAPAEASAAANLLERRLDDLGVRFRRGELTLEQAIREVESPAFLEDTFVRAARPFSGPVEVNLPRTALEVQQVADEAGASSVFLRMGGDFKVTVGEFRVRDGAGGFFAEFDGRINFLNMDRFRANLEERYHAVQSLRKAAGEPPYTSELFRQSPAGIAGVTMTRESDVYRKMLEVLGSKNVPRWVQRLYCYPERATVPIPPPIPPGQ